MAELCSHLPEDLAPPALTARGCQDCIAAGKRDWVQLRFCQQCGHIGCCDNSPRTHATQHYRSSGHLVVRSFEPGDNWWFCYADEELFEIEDSPPAPSYADGT